MKTTAKVLIGGLAMAGVMLVASACSEVTVPNYNNPSLEQLTGSPTLGTVNTATVGMLINLRGRVGTEATALGILGKELYNLDQAEPRNVLSYLQGPIEPGGFVQDLSWTTGYRNLRQGATVLEAVDKVADFSAAQREGIRGFVKTIMAIELLTQIRIRDTAGIMVDISADPAQPLGEIVGKDAALARISQLLDEAKTHLAAAVATTPVDTIRFSFPLHSGFAGFSTPRTFLQFNRGIKARVEVYRKQWPAAITALSESFIDVSSGSAATLAKGVYHVFSTASGDAPNPQFDPTPARLYVHPSILSGAKLRANGQPDLRLTSKTAQGITRVVQQVQGTHAFTIYSGLAAPVPIIKNEELILLRAEARYQSGDQQGALNDINFIRTNSGGLPALTGFASANEFIDELLYNRTYSLLSEAGHRWVDARRYNRLSQLPRINTAISEKTFPFVMFPIDECNQRAPAPQPGCTQVGAVP